MAENRCVCCGAVIPEGTQVCPKCTKEYWNHEAKVSRNARKGEVFKRIMFDWVWPLIIIFGVIFFCILLSKA